MKYDRPFTSREMGNKRTTNAKLCILIAVLLTANSFLYVLNVTKHDDFFTIDQSPAMSPNRRTAVGNEHPSLLSSEKLATRQTAVDIGIPFLLSYTTSTSRQYLAKIVLPSLVGSDPTPETDARPPSETTEAP